LVVHYAVDLIETTKGNSPAYCQPLVEVCLSLKDSDTKDCVLKNDIKYNDKELYFSYIFCLSRRNFPSLHSLQGN